MKLLSYYSRWKNYDYFAPAMPDGKLELSNHDDSILAMAKLVAELLYEITSAYFIIGIPVLLVRDAVYNREFSKVGTTKEIFKGPFEYLILLKLSMDNGSFISNIGKIDISI